MLYQLSYAPTAPGDPPLFRMVPYAPSPPYVVANSPSS
jgi:hypothetical protein